MTFYTVSKITGEKVYDAIVRMAYKGYTLSIIESEIAVFNDNAFLEARIPLTVVKGDDINALHRAMAAVDNYLKTEIAYPVASIVEMDGEQYLIESVTSDNSEFDYSLFGHAKLDTQGFCSAWHTHSELTLVSIPTSETWLMLNEAIEYEDDDEEDEEDEEEDDEIEEDEDEIVTRAYSPEELKNAEVAARSKGWELIDGQFTNPLEDDPDLDDDDENNWAALCNEYSIEF